MTFCARLLAPSWMEEWIIGDPNLQCMIFMYDLFAGTAVRSLYYELETRSNFFVRRGIPPGMFPRKVPTCLPARRFHGLFAAARGCNRGSVGVQSITIGMASDEN